MRLQWSCPVCRLRWGADTALHATLNETPQGLITNSILPRMCVVERAKSQPADLRCCERSCKCGKRCMTTPTGPTDLHCCSRRRWCGWRWWGGKKYTGGRIAVPHVAVTRPAPTPPSWDHIVSFHVRETTWVLDPTSDDEPLLISLECIALKQPPPTIPLYALRVSPIERNI